MKLSDSGLEILQDRLVQERIPVAAIYSTTNIHDFYQTIVRVKLMSVGDTRVIDTAFNERAFQADPYEAAGAMVKDLITKYQAMLQ